MIQKKTFKIVGMHCSSCAINIDGELEDTVGVLSANTSYAKQVVEVAFDQEELHENRIIAIVKNIGYTLTPVP